LRYSIYEVKEKFVPIPAEVEYLRHYIDFEKIRLGDRVEFTENIEDNNIGGIKIAPMILIVFLENAFKHSKNSRNEKIQVSVSLLVSDNSLVYQVKNSYDKSRPTNSEAGSDNGLGLENVKKRLNLLYPGKHDLKITEDEAFFEVKLWLKISK
jgi:sensor histidine kinase YesM